MYCTIGGREEIGRDREGVRKRKFHTYPVLGINAGGTAAVFKVTEDLESIGRAASIGIHPVDTCSVLE